jgi:hypothetical protein
VLLQLDNLCLCCLLGRDNEGIRNRESAVILLELLDPGLLTSLGLRFNPLENGLVVLLTRFVEERTVV